MAFCTAYTHELGEASRVAVKASLKLRMNLNYIAGKLKYVDEPAFYQLYKFHRACSILYLSASEEQQNILSPPRFRDKCLNRHSPLSWARYVLMLTATR